jgi:hypothetical protein
MRRRKLLVALVTAGRGRDGRYGLSCGGCGKYEIDDGLRPASIARGYLVASVGGQQ